MSSAPESCPLASASGAVSKDANGNEVVSTNHERTFLVASFMGLALWASLCPCEVIFKCHRPEVLAVLSGLFIWIFLRTS